MVSPPINHVTWPQTHRIVRARFPPIDLFEDIAAPVDWDAPASQAWGYPSLELRAGNSWDLSRNGVKNYSKGPCVTFLE